MLDRLRRVSTTPHDDGAALVAVVVVMLVGFIIAATVASSVFATIGSNARNEDQTQAFIAAESGRDVARAGLAAVAAGGTCTAGTLTGSSTGSPSYAFDVYTTDATDAAVLDDPLRLPGLAKACPSSTTARVVIASTGIVNGGLANQTTSDVAAVYSWDRAPASQPGTVAYFDGQFKTTKSDYVGDLVIRENSYECNSGSNITGSLWVLGGESGNVGGDVEISTGCNVTGSIYARGTVTTKGGGGQGGVTIGGDIVTQKGDINIALNGMTVGGSFYSGKDVILKHSGAVKDITAKGTIDKAQWTVTGTATPNAGAPAFDPTLDKVWEITKWRDLGASGWESETATEVVDGCSIADRDNPVSLLDDSAVRLVLDYRSCNPTISLGAGTVTRDAVLLFAANAKMTVNVGGPLTSGSNSQIMFVHIDKTPGNNLPNCGNTTKQGNKTVEVPDSFNVNSLNPAVRMMVYSPCGLTGQMKQDFTGQLYTNSDGTTRANHSLFTCAPMSWPPILNHLSCTIKGEGGAIGGGAPTVSLGDRLFQTELSIPFTP